MSKDNFAGQMVATIETGEADAKAVAAPIYLTPTFSAIEFAERYVARRLHVSAPLARVVVDLAGLARCA